MGSLFSTPDGTKGGNYRTNGTKRSDRRANERRGATNGRNNGQLFVNLSKAFAGLYRTTGAFQQAFEMAEPSVQIVAKYAPYIVAFHAFLNIAGVAAAFMQVYQLGRISAELNEVGQEMAAQTSLKSQKDFASHVLDHIRMEVKKTLNDGNTHLFFLYHPDTDWHPRFFRLVEKEPLPNSFCGLSENLNALCIWMRFLRLVLSRTSKTREPAANVVFHVLMPAYRSFQIREPLEFSEQLQPLHIHGLLHKGGRAYVKLNLCNAGQIQRHGVGICEPQGLRLLFWPAERRVLGHIPEGAAENMNIPEENNGTHGSRRRERRHS